jgi:conjugal transfer pilus assembly protein TraB
LAAAGSSWAATTARRATIPPRPRPSTRPGLVNRDLSQREFVATYGNRLDAVTREQKALKDASLPREEIEAQLAALKAENQAMRVDGQAAIDAISAENADLKTRLASQSTSAPRACRRRPMARRRAAMTRAAGRPRPARRRAGGGR